MFNKSTMQCAVVLEKFHKSRLIRADSDFGLTPHKIRLPGIQGSDQKRPYLVCCPPVVTKMCKNQKFPRIARETFLGHFLACKWKLPYPQEAALRCPNLTPFVDAEE